MNKSKILALITIMLFINLPLISALQLSNVQATAITPDSALITWDTDEPVDSFVSYGDNKDQLTKIGDSAALTEHSLPLTNLKPETKYFFKVESGGITDDKEYSFETLPPDTTPPTFEIEFPKAIQGDSLNLIGTTEAGSNIQILVNGDFRTSVFTEDANGTFSFNNIQLSANTDNKVILIATDPADNTATIEATIFADTSKPKITIEEIPLLIGAKTFTLKGNISEQVEYEIFVNNNSRVKKTGTSFSQSISLQEGTNQIKITATDAAGWTTTEEFETNSDAKPLFLKFDVEKGLQYYEGRAKSSINGETKPGADVYLYIYKPLGFEFKVDFKRARAKVTADAEGKFTFKDVRFEISPLEQLDQLAPKEVPSGLQQISIFPVRDVLTQQQATYHIYLIAEDTLGRTAFQQRNVQVHSCFSGSLDFSVTSLAQFQGPLRLNPTLLDEGRQDIQAVFDLQYLGNGIGRSVSGKTIEQPYKIQSIQITKACTPEMQKDSSTSLGCKLMSTTKGKPLRSADDSKIYVSWKLNGAAEFSDREDDFWDDFEKRQLVFPLKLRLGYTERNSDGTFNQQKFQTVCYDLGYFVDIPLESKEYIPDWLAEDTLSGINATLNIIQDIKPIIEEIYIWTGITAMASFVLKTVTRGVRIVSSNLEYYFTFLKKQKNGEDVDEDKSCPSLIKQQTLYLDSTIDNWKELYDSTAWPDKTQLHLPENVRQHFEGEITKELISMDSRCPSTATLWKAEAELDQAMKWTWDRAFCREVPAGWTDTETIEKIDEKIIAQSSCAVTGRGIRLQKVENCKKQLEPASFKFTPTHLRNSTANCWRTADNTLYVRDTVKDKGKSADSQIYHLTAVGNLYPNLAPLKPDLLVYKAPGSEDYFIARDQTCEKVCKNPGKPGYTSVGCKLETSAGGSTKVTVKKGEYLAGFTSDCFVKETAAAPQFSQCVCKGTKPDDTNQYSSLSAVRKIDTLKEDWSYRQSRVFKESAKTAGRYYPKERYYTGRDFSGAFGQNSIPDYFREDKQTPTINPHSGFVQSVQSVCIAGVLKNIVMLESILVGFRNCIQEAKYTGFHDAGMCKTLLTQHVCGLIYKTVAAATSSCSPSNFDDVGKTNSFDDIGVVLGATSDGMSQALSSSIDDVQEEYGNAAVNQYFKGGVQGVTQSICLAAFGYDVPIFSREFLLDAAYAFPMQTSVIVAPAIRELSTYNPQTKTAIYNYEVGGVIFPGCRIKTWRLSLKCIGPEDIGRSGVDNTCDGEGCDCLQATNPADAQARIKVLKAGINLDSGRMFDIPLQSPIKVDGAYRYDHVMLELVLDPTEKGNEDKCFDSEFAEGNKATYYFPITDVSPPGGFQCKPDLTTGRFFCPELFDFFDLGGAYLEPPFVSCFNKETGQYTPDCRQPNLFTLGDQIKTKVHIFTDGKGQCVRRKISPPLAGLEELPPRRLPQGVPGPLPMPDIIGVVTEAMLGGTGLHTLKSLPSSSAVCSLSILSQPSVAQNVNQQYRFQFTTLADGKLTVKLTRGFVTTPGFKLNFQSEIVRISDGVTAFTKDEINALQFNLDGFIISNIFQNNININANGECAYEQIQSINSKQVKREIAVTYDLLELDETGGCINAHIPVKSRKRSHTVRITLQRERTSFAQDTGIHAKFMAGDYENVHILADAIIRQEKDNLFNALGLYYDIASYIMQGKGITEQYKVPITNQLNVFFSQQYASISSSGEYQKIKAYLCAVDKHNAVEHQAQCQDIIQTSISITAPTAITGTTGTITSTYLNFAGCSLTADSGNTEAIGGSNKANGKLKNGIQLTTNPNLIARTTNRGQYGTIELLNILEKASCSTNKLHNAKLMVADLSKQGGGILSGHKSHRNGLDVDVGIYFYEAGKLSNNLKKLCETSSGNCKPGTVKTSFNNPQAIKANLDFIKGLINAGDIKLIILDQELQKIIKSGVSTEDWNQIKNSLIHVEGHYNHYHIRIACPPSDSQCQNT